MCVIEAKDHNAIQNFSRTEYLRAGAGQDWFTRQCDSAGKKSSHQGGWRQEKVDRGRTASYPIVWGAPGWHYVYSHESIARDGYSRIKGITMSGLFL
jgi:hypothetical protein